MLTRATAVFRIATSVREVQTAIHHRSIYSVDSTALTADLAALKSNTNCLTKAESLKLRKNELKLFA